MSLWRDEPVAWVRCLACGQPIETDLFDYHISDECDGVGFEDIAPEDVPDWLT